MNKKRAKKSDYITAYNTNQRRILINYLQKDPEYKSHVEQGLPFYTEEELKNIETKYRDGMAWADINKELTQKGVILKKPTFRKYLQSKWLPQATTEIMPSKKGKELKYPSEIIAHINFVKYFFYAGQKEILAFINVLDLFDSIALIECIKEELSSGFSEDLTLAIGLLLFNGAPDINYAIDNHFKKNPDKNIERQTRDQLEAIEKNYYEYVQPKIDSFILFLEDTPITGRLERLLEGINKTASNKQ
ncbi:hypothetical protein C4553_01050 [Candidatus Parcubacteria bacterium]|nr:MAG: hypothetical protein C4553_01050 [Candidatus Parcubacteria bacterium]